MIEEDKAQLELGTIIELFQLDMTNLGQGVVYFVDTNTTDGSVIQFGGIVYTPVDVMAEGFETNGQGPFPQPIFRVANTTRALTGLVNSLDDLIGARVTRTRTLSKYLDNQPTADPSAHFPPDVFVVEQKTAQNRLFIEFKLSSAIDVEGQTLPRRVIARDYCSFVYRKWDSANSSFDYTNATCPYTGTNYFDIAGNPSTAAKDNCRKRVVDCRNRFGRTSPLPTRAFPGAGRFGQQSS